MSSSVTKLVLPKTEFQWLARQVTRFYDQFKVLTSREQRRKSAEIKVLAGLAKKLAAATLASTARSCTPDSEEYEVALQRPELRLVHEFALKGRHQFETMIPGYEQRIRDNPQLAAHYQKYLDGTIKSNEIVSALAGRIEEKL